MSVTGLLITNGGAAAITADLTGGADLVLSHVAWGDSGGVPYDPVVTQAALVNERYRATIAAVAVIDGAIVVDAILPADTNDATGRPSHSFTVAECGLFSAPGTLIGVARMGDGFKPGPATGQAVIATYRLKLAVANPSAITVVVDPQAQIALGRNVRAGWMTVDGVLNAPPVGPAVGATYVVGAAPTGAWTGFAGRLAQWVGVWSLATVPVGHVVSDNSAAMNAASRYLRWTGAAWVSAAAATDAYGVTRRATPAEVAARSTDNLFVAPSDLSNVVQLQPGNYVTAAGGPNAITLTATPAFASLAAAVGVPLRFSVPARNTGAVTIALNGLGALPLVWPNFAPLQAGDILQSQMVEVILQPGAAQYQMQSPNNGRRRIRQLLTASGTWTAPLGCSEVSWEMVGGGGGGAGAIPSSAASGGGSGGRLIGISKVIPGTNYAYTIGAAGAASGSSADGGNGGTTTMADWGSAHGGTGGEGPTASYGIGGSRSGGWVTFGTGALHGVQGQASWPGTYAENSGGARVYYGGNGGSGPWGSGGGESPGTGLVAGGHGCGGGGGANGWVYGGHGTAGLIILEYWI